MRRRKPFRALMTCLRWFGQGLAMTGWWFMPWTPMPGWIDEDPDASGASKWAGGADERR